MNDLRPTAHAKFRKVRPNNSLSFRETCKVLFLDLAKVCRLVKAGELVYVHSLTGDRRTRWITKKSIEAYIDSHRAEVAARALEKGILG